MAVLIRWRYEPYTDGVPAYRATVRRGMPDDPTVTFDHDFIVHLAAAESLGWLWSVTLHPTGSGLTRPAARMGCGHAPTPEAAMRAAEDWFEDQPDTGVEPVDPDRQTERLPWVGPPPTEPQRRPLEEVTDDSPTRPAGPTLAARATRMDPSSWWPPFLRRGA